MEFDSALEKVSAFKPIQLAVFTFICLSKSFIVAIVGVSVIFIGWQPKHYCNSSLPYLDFSSNSSDVDISLQTDNQRNLSELVRIDLRCHQYELRNITTHNGTKLFYKAAPCIKGWTYINEGYHTIVEEWDLICERGFLVELSQSVLPLGSLIGDSLLTFLIDKYGRKTLHLVTHAAICITGIAHAFSTNYIMFVVTKVVLGMFSTVNFTSGNLLSLEMFSSKRRALSAMGGQLVVIAIFIVTPILAWNLTNWRHFLLFTTTTSALFLIAGMFLPESPQWLFSVGRFEEADKILRTMAKWNGVKLTQGTKLISPVTIEIKLADRDGDGLRHHEVQVTKTKNLIGNSSLDKNAGNIMAVKDHSFNIINNDTAMAATASMPLTAKHLFTDPTLLKFIILMSFIWFSNNIVMSGVILATPSLGGNRFFNFFLLFIVDIPSLVLATAMCSRIGRKPMLFFSQLLGGIFAGSIVLMPLNIAGINIFWWRFVLIVLSKSFLMVSRSVIFLYTKEIFPVRLCATANGICQLWGRIALILAPTASYMMKTDYKKMPFILFAFISISSSLMMYFLPETKDKISPQTPNDCTKLYKKNKI